MAHIDTIEMPLKNERFNKWHYLILGLIIFLMTIDGIDAQILAVTVSTMSKEWGLPISAFGTAMAANHFGTAIGASLGGIIADKFGRKPTLIFGAILFGTCTIAMSFAKNTEYLVVFRIISGLGLGGCMPPALALLTETMPSGKKGLAISIAILCQPLGITLIGLSGPLIQIIGWRPLYIIAGIIPYISALLCLLFLPESPAFLAKNETKKQEMDALIEKLELKILKPRIDLYDAKTKGTFSLLFAKGERLKVITLFATFFFSFLAMAMVLSWLPALLSKVGFAQSFAGYSISVWSFAGMLGVVITGFSIARFGPDRVAIGFLSFGILILTIVAISLPSPLDGSQIGLIRFYILIGLAGMSLNGVLTSLYAYTTAFFASTVRATGLGIASTCGRIGAISGAFIGVYFIQIFGTSGFFAAVAFTILCSLMCFVFGIRNQKLGSPPA